MVYVVVRSGEIISDPLRATAPISGEMTHVSAYSEYHNNWVVSPDVIVAGVADMLTVGRGGADTVMVTLSVAAPSGPITVIV
jgi:hypothetical protein